MLYFDDHLKALRDLGHVRLDILMPTMQLQFLQFHKSYVGHLMDGVVQMILLGSFSLCSDLMP